MGIFKRFAVGVIVLLALILVYLTVIIFFPVLSVPKQPARRRTGDSDDGEEPPSSRQDVTFTAVGQKIAGWLYLPPTRTEPVPCVVMNHGFGGTKDCLLEDYALRFVQAGMAVLTYDYRHFGKSEGEPRQLFSMASQHEDARAAVHYARSREEVDPEKIALWGTSASGGYGLIIAAEDNRVAAVIAQCAALDHDADSKLYLKQAGLGHLLRLVVHAQRDKGRSRLGLSAHMIPMVGKPGTLAMHTAPGAFEGYARIFRESATFQNEVCARFLLMPHDMDMVKAAERVRCPVLILACERDNLVAFGSHRKVAAKLGDRATVQTFPIGHFEIYEGAWFERAVKAQISFLHAAFQGSVSGPLANTPAGADTDETTVGV